MRIYVDFDDVLCETARELNAIARRLFGTTVAYEDMREFELDKSFSLSRGQYETLMGDAHGESVLGGLRETPGATSTIRKWLGQGHRVEVVTGRRYSTRGTSRAWLDRHGLGDLPVIHVDKFNREPPPPAPDAPRPLSVEEFCRLSYDFAVEDSPMGLAHLARIKGCRVAAFARPWNERVALPSRLFRRCAGWKEIDEYFSSLQDAGGDAAGTPRR